jgi:hypothetical protein
MPQQDFELIGGMVLNEISRNRAGDFSFPLLLNAWNTQLSAGAKRVLFSPQHRQAIEDIINLGTTVRGVTREENVSQSGNAMIAYGVLSSLPAIIGGAAAVYETGSLPESGYGAAAAAAPLYVGAYLLGRPVAARASANWLQRATAALDNPTPVRIAGFKVATRNLAHNLGLDADQLWRQVERSISGQPQAPEGLPPPGDEVGPTIYLPRTGP